MKRTITTMLAAAAVLVLSHAAAADDFHWQGTVAGGAAVEIKGVNGPITATGTAGDKVELTAIKHAKRSDPAAVEIKLVEHAGGVTICAVYPSAKGARPNLCAPGDGGRNSAQGNDVWVEFKVAVPAGVRLVARTVNGAVTASSLTADADVTTVNGGVSVDTGGAARARTVNGGITARMGRGEWSGTLDLQTVNGGVLVTLPAGVSAEVSANTVNGGIDTDFPLSVRKGPGGHSAHGTLGTGGRRLEMRTVNGAITLRKAAARS